MDEAGASGSIEPGNPADDMIRAVMADHFFSGEFGLSVNGGSAGRNVKFMIRAVQHSIEDVVCGDGDQADSLSVTGGCDVGGTECIQPIGKIYFGFAPVHGGHRRAVNDGFRAGVSKKAVESRRIGDIRLRKICNDYFVFGENLLKGSSEHSFSSRYEQFHCPHSFHGSISEKLGRQASFGERIHRSGLMRQSMPSAGSSNAIPRS